MAQKLIAVATVTHSRIPNRVRTKLKPYRPVFTGKNPHRNSIILISDGLIPSGLTICQRKKFGHTQPFCTGFCSVGLLISLLIRFELHQHTANCIGPWRTHFPHPTD